ncbi:unnamed protein product [Trifolium pratense]|uniref:Uncharacterized protein n=1 Tax=Trifolium pratense TaxID=57577 RepID=A0ACB0JYE8_TRIPR|nr:unnamed protein product [Trifolium pratense]
MSLASHATPPDLTTIGKQQLKIFIICSNEIKLIHSKPMSLSHAIPPDLTMIVKRLKIAIICSNGMVVLDDFIAIMISLIRQYDFGLHYFSTYRIKSLV